MRYRLIHLFWGFPLYLFFITGHQFMVYSGMKSTLDSGQPIEATVVDAQIKRIASQSNGWVILRFTEGGQQAPIEQKLGLPVNIASKLMLDPRLDIRYKADSFIPIVILKTADIHINVVLINLSIALVSSLFVAFIAYLASRFAERKVRLQGADKLQIQRID